MVVATKRAVGSEYNYYYQRLHQAPDTRKQARKRTVRRTSPIAAAAKGVCLITLIFLVGLSFIYLKAYQAELHYKTSLLRDNMVALQTENEKIELEIAKLKALDRIEVAAASQLGMVKNDTVEYLSLEVGFSNQPAIKQIAPPPTAPLPKEPAGTEENARKGETLLARIADAFAAKSKMAKG